MRPTEEDMREIHVKRGDIRDARIVERAPAALAEGAARLKIDLFGLSSNNITYAAMGDGQLGYWDFFPAADGYGRPPVWGFGTVTESRAPGVDVGARYYGYYPLGETLDVVPTRASARGFSDGAAHRAAKAPIYNQYIANGADPVYDAAFEAEQVLLRPVYGSGWWLADFVHQGKPKTVISSSASSKSALAMADHWKRLGVGAHIGLTSARNADYVRDSGLYDRVVTYDELAALKADGPATYVDFMGSAKIRNAAATALGDTLTRSVLFGATDWEATGGPPSAPVGPAPEFFFTPTHVMARVAEDPALGERSQRDMRAFFESSGRLITPRRVTGADAILDAWRTLARGETAPRDGIVCSF